jgi:hypothetical protein
MAMAMAMAMGMSLCCFAVLAVLAVLCSGRVLLLLMY